VVYCYPFSPGLINRQAAGLSAVVAATGCGSGNVSQLASAGRRRLPAVTGARCSKLPLQSLPVRAPA